MARYKELYDVIKGCPENLYGKNYTLLDYLAYIL